MDLRGRRMTEAPTAKRKDQAVSQAVGKKELAGGEDDVLFGHPKNPTGVVLGAEEHIILGVGHALGFAGAARAVEHEGDAVLRGGMRIECGSGFPEQPGISRLVGAEGLTQGTGLCVYGLGRADRDQRRRLCIVQDIFVAAPRQIGAQEYRTRAVFYAAQEGIKKVGAIRQGDDNPLFGP